MRESRRVGWQAAAVVLAVGLRPGAAAAAPMGRWTNEIADASSRFDIPARWIRRVMAVESGGRAERRGVPVVSRAGAMGLMQLMPGTWQDMRQRLGLDSDPFDPRNNILAGTAYLRLMYDRFGYPGLFAAYNAGPGRYSAAVAGRRRLPAETTAYLAAVTSTRRDPSKARRGASVVLALQRSGAPSVRQGPSAIFAIERPGILSAVETDLPETPSRSSLFVALAGSGTAKPRP